MHNIKKEELRGIDAAKGVTRISTQRPHVLEDVEKLLLVWINEKQVAGDTVTENFICEKAKALYTDLVSKMPVHQQKTKMASMLAGNSLVTLRGEVASIVL